MRGACWGWVEAAARLLEANEREAVLGDLAEAGLGGWRGLREVFGLVARRQTLLWRSWRPWLALFGLALPACLHLMGVSVGVGLDCVGFAGHAALGAGARLLREGLLLIAGAWICGYAAGAMSRSTLWVNVAACGAPCVFCLMRFRQPTLSPLCLFLFVLPVAAGAWMAWRRVRIPQVAAVMTAAVIVAAMLPGSSGASWALNWPLAWPAWYLVASAPKRVG